MGKAARRERNKTTRFLSRLATENPDRFNSEWDFRIGSWLVEIRTGFGHGFIDARPVFNVLEKALNLLKECGDTAMRLQFRRTFDILSTECIRVTARQMPVGQYGNVLYKINQKYGFLDYDPRNIKLNGKGGSRDGLRRLSPR
jgi:hypothetical protein